MLRRCGHPMASASVLLMALVLASAAAGGPASGQSDTGPKKLTHIAVIGERHSGTNYMKSLMAENFGDQNGGSVKVLENYCQFKHYYQFKTDKCPPLQRTLVIVMTRNPYDWALGMHKKCWCSAADDELAAMPFEQFIDRKFKEFNRKPWMSERHGGYCTPLMRCRTMKYLNFFNMTSWVPRGLLRFVRHEDVLSPYQARGFVKQISQRYGLKMSGGSPSGIKTYKGWQEAEFDAQAIKAKSAWANRHRLKQDNPKLHAKMELLLKQTDYVVESMFGYHIQTRPDVSEIDDGVEDPDEPAPAFNTGQGGEAGAQQAR